MTERLYYTDAYLARFDAVVTDRTDGGRRVYLDRTAFYPTSGGQPFDTGRLGGVTVVNVVDEGDRIAHLVAGPVEGIASRARWTGRGGSTTCSSTPASISSPR
jgi:Predicted metal-dependent hydrolases related to alanyl-tRNA synthetase HxxxH domain